MQSSGSECTRFICPVRVQLTPLGIGPSQTVQNPCVGSGIVGLPRFVDSFGFFPLLFLFSLMVVLADLRDLLSQIGEQRLRELGTAALILYVDLAIGAKPHRVFSEAVVLDAPTNQEAEMPRHDILLLAAVHPHESLGCNAPA